jgi:hypothetical protein
MREQTRNGEHRPRRRIVKSATEARQGEIILDKRGIWIWIAAFVVIAALAILAA